MSPARSHVPCLPPWTCKPIGASASLEEDVPMCRVMCPTIFPLANEVTRRLLSQCPPLKSSFPSGDTASVREQRSVPGAKGPCRKRWVLAERDTGWLQSHGWAGGTSGDHPWGPLINSLCAGDGGVFGEAEVVGDVLVIGQPVVGPQQAVGTHGDLGRDGGDAAPTTGALLGFSPSPPESAACTRASVSPHSPGCQVIPE